MSEIPALCLGVYHYINEDLNSQKFWSVIRNARGEFVTSWGRIGTRGQSKIVDEATAYKKVQEKISKGYVQVEKQDEIHLSKTSYEEKRTATKKTSKKKEKWADWTEDLKKL